jgi:lysine 6-dehydrogenase
VRGTKGGKPAERRFDLVDRYDEAHGISAMMRTTGYSLSITGTDAGTPRGRTAGRVDSDECMPAEAYIAELRKRGIELKETVS